MLKTNKNLIKAKSNKTRSSWKPVRYATNGLRKKHKFIMEIGMYYTSIRDSSRKHAYII